MSKNTLRVYDTIAKKYVEVEVSENVRVGYNRSQWNIDDNDKSFYQHEIQFSALIGGIDGAFENFHEFVTDKDVTERNVMLHAEYDRLHSRLALLSDDERKLIELIYFKNLTIEECGKYLGITHQAVSKKRKRILCKLYKLLK